MVVIFWVYRFPPIPKIINTAVPDSPLSVYFSPPLRVSLTTIPFSSPSSTSTTHHSSSTCTASVRSHGSAVLTQQLTFQRVTVNILSILLLSDKKNVANRNGTPCVEHASSCAFYPLPDTAAVLAQHSLRTRCSTTRLFVHLAGPCRLPSAEDKPKRLHF